jgi:Tfp pilus assembly PilM family ATPase
LALFTGKKIIGVEIQEDGIWLTELLKKGRHNSLERAHFEVAPSARSDEIILTLSAMVQKHDLAGEKASMIINDSRILHKAYSFPKMSPRELSTIVPLESRKEFGVRNDFQIVYDINSVFKEEGLQKVEVLAAAVPIDLIQLSYRILSESGLIPCMLMTIPMSERFAPSRRNVMKDDKTAALLHTTRKGIHLSVYQGKRYIFSRVLKKKFDFNKIEEETSSSSVSDIPSNAESDSLNPSEFNDQSSAPSTEMEHPFERLAKEVQRSFLYVRQHNRVTVETVWVTGEGALSPLLCNKLEEELELPVSVPQSLQGLDHHEAEADVKTIAAQFDLCLAGALFDSPYSTGNLLPKDIQRKRKNQDLQKIGKAVSMIIAALLIILYIHIEWRMKQLSDEYKTIQNHVEIAKNELSHRTEEVSKNSSRIVKAGLVQSLAKETIPFGNFLIALSLYTRPEITLDELMMKNENQIFIMEISGHLSLDDLSSGDRILDEYLRQLKTTGLYHSVQGLLGSGSKQGETGQMIIQKSASSRNVMFHITGN